MHWLFHLKIRIKSNCEEEALEVLPNVSLSVIELMAGWLILFYFYLIEIN